MPQTNITAKGLGYSIVASLLFGIFPWYVQFLKPLDGTEIFLYRVIFSVLVAALFISIRKNWKQVRLDCTNISILIGLLPGTFIVAVQWWLFSWAPLNEKATEVSLGYFLLPLTMVLAGRLFLKESLRPLQWVAVFFASIGVAHELWSQQSISWVILTIAGLYPIYFLLRRRLTIDTVSAFFIENVFMVIPILVGLLFFPSSWNTVLHTPALWLLLPGLGIISTAAMLIYVAASKLMPIGLFGMLSYLEPVILFLIAILALNEPVSASEWLTHGFIWCAVIVICIDSGWQFKRQSRQIAQP